MSTEATDAVRAGAARALAEVLRARRPDLAVEITFGEKPGKPAARVGVNQLEPIPLEDTE